MVKVVGVRFKKAGKIYYFDPGDINIESNEKVIVETSRGIEFGDAVIGEKMVGEKDIVQPLKHVIRIATEEDRKHHKENMGKKDKAIEVCQEKVDKHELDMKLIDVEYTFDNNKIIFYFTAEGRVDFRELVKDLAAVFKMRIELRQIGVRDEAKILGGIGACGKGLCCATWLGEFDPVSIKMAKVQNLSLNPTKISGICGRLLCCLKYESDTYCKLREQLPEQGDKVKTPEGNAIVMSNNVLKENVRVRYIIEDHGNDHYKLSDDVVTYGKKQVQVISAEKKKKDKDAVKPEEMKELKGILDK